VIELRDLTIFHDRQRALGPLSGVFGEGTLVVAGPAQCGKTTLLKAMCGLVVPTSGQVLIDGEDLAAADSDRLAALRARLGMVFQSDALFDSMDALANVALPLLRRSLTRREAEARAREALAQVGLAGQERALPERLSGGMRKRLGLARAIVARPRLLLADDPLAGLDPGTSARVLDLLFDLWRGRGGLIIATADPGPLWERCDEVLVLDAGEPVARGPVDGVRGEPRLARLFGEAAA
jgi:phospholipid/cholesterol/gamma-HCH transport system ATP-binding protein